VGRDIPVQNIQSVKIFQYKYSVGRDIPVQNMQSVRKTVPRVRLHGRWEGVRDRREREGQMVGRKGDNEECRRRENDGSKGCVCGGNGVRDRTKRYARMRDHGRKEGSERTVEGGGNTRKTRISRRGSTR
jgi:hypothetical protein